MAAFLRFKEQIQNNDLLQEALTHSSLLHEDVTAQASYERLEFLGDSILGFICSETLSRRSPTLNEGQLSRLRSLFVSEGSLAMRARDMDIGEHIRFSKGESMSGGSERDSILADVMEALVAVAYLDQGIEFAQTFLCSVVFPEWELPQSKWDAYVKTALEKDPKSRLQEFCQKLGVGLPVYKCLNEASATAQGPFQMGVFIQEKLIEEAQGNSKKEGTLRIASSLLDLGPQKIVDLLKVKGALNSETLRHDLGTLER